MIRLTRPFREHNGQYNETLYFLNLSLLELTFKELDRIDILPINEKKLKRDGER